MKTVGDLRRRACEASESLWEAFDLPDDMPLDELRERWTPETAIELARLDSVETRVGAVAWVDRILGTRVLAGADLSELDLREIYLSGVDMSHARLRGACMSWASLRGARLIGVDLRDAYVDHAALHGCDFREADLRGADLRMSYMRDADLRGADMSCARLRGAYVLNVRIRGARLDGAQLDPVDAVYISMRRN